MIRLGTRRSNSLRPTSDSSRPKSHPKWPPKPYDDPTLWCFFPYEVPIWANFYLNIPTPYASESGAALTQVSPASAVGNEILWALTSLVGKKGM